MTEYGTGTLPYSGDNRDVVRTHTLNHSLSLYNENLRNARRLQSTHRSLRIFSKRMSTIMMILRLQELVPNLYVEVLFVRCTVFWLCSCFLRRSCPTSVCTTLRSIRGFSHTAMLSWFQVSLSEFVWYLHFIVTRTSIQRITTSSLRLL